MIYVIIDKEGNLVARCLSKEKAEKWWMEFFYTDTHIVEMTKEEYEKYAEDLLDKCKKDLDN